MGRAGGFHWIPSSYIAAQPLLCQAFFKESGKLFLHRFRFSSLVLSREGVWGTAKRPPIVFAELFSKKRSGGGGVGGGFRI